MSMNRISMALDDVVKADKKANKGKKNGNKGGANKAKGAVVNKPATAKLVQKLVKRALAQRGVGVKPKNNARKPTGNRTVVKKVIRKVNNSPKNRNKSLGVSQRSRTIIRRRVIPAPQPTRTIVREVRYIREAPRPAPRRIIYERPQPARRQVVYVDSPRRQERGRFGSVYSQSSRRPTTIRRNADPFYEPRNFLQRVPRNRY